MSIHCLIFSRYNVVYDGEADMVTIPSINGQLGILPHHISMYTKLTDGIITVKLGGVSTDFTATGGFVQVLPGTIRILADSSENVEGIDVQRAEAARSRAADAMKRAPSKDSMEFVKALMLWKKSNLRVKAGRRAMTRNQWIPRTKR
ncbi:MAG: ATP synthase F1 subunit epsilon [Flexilinea sp.]